MGQEQLLRLTTKDRQKIPAEHKSPREQGGANFKIPTLKRTSYQPGDTNATSHTVGNKDTMHIIHIRGTATMGPYDPCQYTNNADAI